jgi:hypothetical protein
LWTLGLFNLILLWISGLTDLHASPLRMGMRDDQKRVNLVVQGCLAKLAESPGKMPYKFPHGIVVPLWMSIAWGSNAGSGQAPEQGGLHSLPITK